MKTRSTFFHSLQNIMLIIVSVFGITAIVTSCGGGDDDDDPIPLNNGLLSGDYQVNTVEFEGVTSEKLLIGSNPGNADGAGTLTIDTNSVGYSITTDRQISIIPDPVYEPVYGIVSTDGNLALISDAQLFDPNDSTDKDVLTILMVKKSTDVDMTITRLSGEYVVSQIGKNTQGIYTSQVEVGIETDGSGTWTILNHSQGSGGSGNITVSVATDGTFTVTPDPVPDPINFDVGIIDPEANMFVVTDGSTLDGDGEQFFAIGVRKSTSALVFSTDTYQLHFIGYDETLTLDKGPQFAARWNAVEDTLNQEFDATAIVDTRGIPAGTTTSISYIPVANGMFDAEGDFGIVSPDGGYFAIVETDQTNDSEMMIGFAIP